MIWFSDIAIYLRYFALLSCGNVAKVLLSFHSLISDQEIFYDFCIFPLQLMLLVLYFIYLLRAYSIICFPALSLWSRSVSMAFNLILVWRFQEI